MACDNLEELEAQLEEARARMEAAEEAYYAAFEEFLAAESALDDARAKRDSDCSPWYRSRWFGACADAIEDVEAAKAESESAAAALEDARMEWGAAQEEVSALIDVLCDCYLGYPHSDPLG